jgi:signal recognition particle subunit SRP9
VLYSLTCKSLGRWRANRGVRAAKSTYQTHPSTDKPRGCVDAHRPVGVVLLPWCTSIRGKSIRRLLKTCTLAHQERYAFVAALDRSTLKLTVWKTRYSVKWKSSEGKLVLKITDNVTVRCFLIFFSHQTYSLAPTQCLKFKTHSSIFLGRFEALNRSLIQKMTNSTPKPTPPALSANPSQAIAASPVIQGSHLSETPVPALTPSGGVKKKKGGKRK